MRFYAGLQAAKGPVEMPGCSSLKQAKSAMYDPPNLTPGWCGCGNQGCAGGVWGREVLLPLNAEVALLFLLGVSPKAPRKLFRRPSTLLLCTAGASVMVTINVVVIRMNLCFSQQAPGGSEVTVRQPTDQCCASQN